ncbi:helix-turn-helix transcriptional regulator [Mycobacterium sp. 050134]|uniref:helix-turn-helix transcriptional regulator n=1 Tax=Mycobacterium sp. 050134 TaxID=3096111 RepID=UPI002ED893F6
MPTVLFDTTDLGEAEDKLSAAFARVKLVGGAEDSTRLRMVRSTVGSLTLDDTYVSHDVTYRMEPPDRVLLCRGYSGVIEGQQAGCPRVVVGPGQIAAFGGVDGLPTVGEVRRAHHLVLSIDRKLLGEVAAADPSDDIGTVRLVGQAAVSPEAHRHLLDVIDHIRLKAATNRLAAASPLVAGAVQRYLAATLLATFPSTASVELTGADRNDTTPVLLRRAIAFIDDNAHRDISLVDIAGAVYVTPRALQYMVRKHRDCTPSEYLRRVRLHQAHLDLVAGNRATTTVGEVARRWGFGNVGRFAVYYRQIYGQSPHVTLRYSQ